MILAIEMIYIHILLTVSPPLVRLIHCNTINSANSLKMDLLRMRQHFQGGTNTFVVHNDL